MKLVSCRPPGRLARPPLKNHWRRQMRKFSKILKNIFDWLLRYSRFFLNDELQYLKYFSYASACTNHISSRRILIFILWIMTILKKILKWGVHIFVCVVCVESPRWPWTVYYALLSFLFSFWLCLNWSTRQQILPVIVWPPSLLIWRRQQS